jgi:hypothetical protein
MVAIGGVISHVRHVPIYYDPNTLSLVVWDGTVTGGGSGGGAVTIANGADVAEGALADAAVTGDNSGSASAKLRGLNKWAYERMPAALGQAAMAASLPVTIASNQAPVLVIAL